MALEVQGLTIGFGWHSGLTLFYRVLCGSWSPARRGWGLGPDHHRREQENSKSIHRLVPVLFVQVPGPTLFSFLVCRRNVLIDHGLSLLQWFVFGLYQVLFGRSQRRETWEKAGDI